ncbi:hypothetical protein BOX15_Mlig034176g1 [Macrostomum lignano]|uniref:Long-chain-acyl-CoA dehydrogenase n=1 Tax=Macrostomum lignano TaxID=282301 RepID=A0A267GJH7_9PLAT|nr:hypothetical protein BOX15_Mlig034176g1 [Macrostomum lignano]
MSLLRLSSGLRFFTSMRSLCSAAVQRPEIGQAGSLLDIGTRRIFTEEHDLLRDTCRKFFRDEVAPNHGEYEKQGHVPKEVWLQAGKLGLLGVSTSEENFGVGLDFKSSMIVSEEQFYANLSGPGFSLHSDIVMPYLSKYGSPEQKERYLPRMTSGEVIGAIAMTEPGAGSDLQGVKTRAVKSSGGDYILNGSKTFITNGWNCDLCIVVAVTDPSAKSPARGISLFLVDSEYAGFRKGRKLDKMGLKAQDTAELFFEDVRLPASALLGQENRGFAYLMSELPRERMLIADIGQASSEWMFEEARSHVRERRAFGRTLSALQTIQHKLADLKTEICVARAFADQCIELQNEGRLDSFTASMAKLWCTEMQNRVAYDCVQLHGGWGYMWEYPIAKAYVDARVQPIYGGANEIMKELIARPICDPGK